MNQGWIKLHRKLLENPIIQKPAYNHLWIVLLLKASHKSSDFIWNNQRCTLQPGQLLVGRKELSRETGIKEGTVECILKYLESQQQIQQQTTPKFRIITIKRWQFYQDVQQQNQQQNDNKITTEQQQNNTYNNDKNEKNEKNEKNYGGGSFDDSFNKQIDKWMDNLKQEGAI